MKMLSVFTYEDAIQTYKALEEQKGDLKLYSGKTWIITCLDMIIAEFAHEKLARAAWNIITPRTEEDL